MEYLFGYIAAVIIGIIMGLLGGGGSILSVPVLVYTLGLNPITATAYSLFIVGSTALVGSFQNFRNGLINVKVGFTFALPSLIAVYLTRRFLIPALPDMFTVAGYSFTKEKSIMVFFAILMLFAAISMVRGSKDSDEQVENYKLNYFLVFIEGAVVGVLTGIVGAGGGFLIIPALVILAKQPMKIAVATSLMIIACKSLFGFLGDLNQQVIDWQFLLSFTGLAVIGIFIGIYSNKYIKGASLKSAFGWFVMTMSIYIFFKELFFN
jgi:uncharacterized membrane protein YfcA